MKLNIPKPRVLVPGSKSAVDAVRNDTLTADGMIAESDQIINNVPGGQVTPVDDSAERNIDDESEKLHRLVEDDFPFDDSQLTAVHGLVQQQYGCLIGAAGTGKTTITKKLVDLLKTGVAEVDVSQYWKRGAPADDDNYEIPSKNIPSICMISYTGRASQMTKKNFPSAWHPNIMTIHRCLGFYPEMFAAYDETLGETVNKRRFVPAYTADNPIPWDIIIIDEAGMLGLDLWHQLWAATPRSTRIYMIGDINQLPPTHGKPILGFALKDWPTWELTHVHRQQGANNSIVDNAHRVLQGKKPICDSGKELSFRTPPQMIEALSFMANDKDWRFLMIDVEEAHPKAAQRIRQGVKLLQGKLYEPNRDVIITPINGFEQTAPGFSIGQHPMNQALVTMLNESEDRYFIDAGRERQNFAVGDKVMATVNDHEAGITNGMTGIITQIAANGVYQGEVHRYGLIADVNEYFRQAGTGEFVEDAEVDFNLDDMVSDSEIGMEEAKKAKAKRDAGPASHIVTVEFGTGNLAFTISFSSKSQVGSLILAYVATCHKMQGGEAPLVFIICHQTTKRMLNREWLYTAITRASERCVLITNRQGLSYALGKQSIKGATLRAKIETFAKLTESGILGPTVRVKLPKAWSLVSESELITKGQFNKDEKAKPKVSLETVLSESSPAPQQSKGPSLAGILSKSTAKIPQPTRAESSSPHSTNRNAGIAGNPNQVARTNGGPEATIQATNRGGNLPRTPNDSNKLPGGTRSVLHTGGGIGGLLAAQRAKRPLNQPSTSNKESTNESRHTTRSTAANDVRNVAASFIGNPDRVQADKPKVNRLAAMIKAQRK